MVRYSYATISNCLNIVRVYILIPELEGKPTAHVYSPRLVHPKQVKEFKKEIFPIETDDEL